MVYPDFLTLSNEFICYFNEIVLKKNKNCSRKSTIYVLRTSRISFKSARNVQVHVQNEYSIQKIC